MWKENKVYVRGIIQNIVSSANTFFKIKKKIHLTIKEAAHISFISTSTEIVIMILARHFGQFCYFARSEK